MFLQHGMSGCSVDFLIDEESLGYALVSAGFDIWLGNVRGNRFSVTRDQACSPEMWDLNHWDHSWHEHAREDLPKMLTLVLKKTGHSCLDYVGHSMGTTMFFLMVSSYPGKFANPISYNLLLFGEYVTAHTMKDTFPRDGFLEHAPQGRPCKAFYCMNKEV